VSQNFQNGSKWTKSDFLDYVEDGALCLNNNLVHKLFSASNEIFLTPFLEVAQKLNLGKDYLSNTLWQTSLFE